MYHWFCKYWQVSFFSNVVKCVRPTYGNKEALAPLTSTYFVFYKFLEWTNFNWEV